MTDTSRRRSRVHLASKKSQQQTMDGKYFCPSSTFLVQKFSLNSYNRNVARKGLGKKPHTDIPKKKKSSDLVLTITGRKCSDLDFGVLSDTFERYRKAVNLVLEKAFSDSAYASDLGRILDESKGQGYVTLRANPLFAWKKDNAFGKLVFGRMHRNVLETAARIIHTDYTRRRLVKALLGILASDEKQLLRLMVNRRVPSDLVRKVRDTIDKRTPSGYHYSLSACKQVRKVLLLELKTLFPIEEGEKQQITRQNLNSDSSLQNKTLPLFVSIVKKWQKTGFPFTTPLFQKNTMDYAASTENATGQGYWFHPDSDKEDEIILYIKTPPGIIGHEDDARSPYKSQSVRLRFLNWLPRKANRARNKALEARESGDNQRAIELEFRAEKFEDMNRQLMNTIKLQQFTRELANSKLAIIRDSQREKYLICEISRLRESRKCAPPIIQAKGNRITLLIPFMSTDSSVLMKTFPSGINRTRKAGVDRGLRYPMVVSVKNGNNDYEEKMIGNKELFEKRERLRQRTRILMSQIARRRNNWEKKHPGLQPPAHILKKERELESVWQKIRRLDKEISHLAASETVWFCEHRNVETIYFEDLRSFQGRGGMKSHSWNLSTNLWGQMIEGVKYRRISLGHRNGRIWMVNPAWTSQNCSHCGERGVRVKDIISTEEERGGEFFYCEKCETRLQADVNAARNILHVQSKPSVASGRTT